MPFESFGYFVSSLLKYFFLLCAYWHLHIQQTFKNIFFLSYTMKMSVQISLQDPFLSSFEYRNGIAESYSKTILNFFEGPPYYIL